LVSLYSTIKMMHGPINIRFRYQFPMVLNPILFWFIQVYFTIFLTSCPTQNTVIHYWQLGLPPSVIELQSNECFYSKGVLTRDSTSPLFTNIWKADRPRHCNVRLKCVAAGSRRRTMTFEKSNPLHQFATHNQQNVPYVFILEYHTEHYYMLRSKWDHYPLWVEKCVGIFSAII